LVFLEKNKAEQYLSNAEKKEVILKNICMGRRESLKN
jgi:hypothetical protein